MIRPSFAKASARQAAAGVPDPVGSVLIFLIRFLLVSSFTNCSGCKGILLLIVIELILEHTG